MFETVAEHRTVRKTGERVVERLAGELLLQGLAFRYVARVEHEAFHRRVFEQVAHDAFDEARRAVGVLHAVFGGGRPSGGSDEACKDDLEERSVLRIQDIQVRGSQEVF